MVNYTNWNDLVLGANSVTSGAWGAIMPFIVTVIAFVYLSPYGFNRAFGAAAFIGFLAALPLYAMGVTSADKIVILFVGVCFGVFLNWR